MVALNSAIEHWDNIVQETDIDRGRRSCPLCILNGSKCAACIIAHVHGEDCSGTPYTQWVHHHENAHCSSSVYYSVKCDTCYERAIDEYNFLKELKSKCKVSKLQTTVEPISRFVINIIKG